MALSEKSIYGAKITKSLLHGHLRQQKKLIHLIDSEVSPPWMSIDCVDNVMYRQVLLIIMLSCGLRIIDVADRFSRTRGWCRGINIFRKLKSGLKPFAFW